MANLKTKNNGNVPEGSGKVRKTSVDKMDSVFRCVCGIDVHSMIIMACIRTGNKIEVIEYEAYTRSLYELCAKLKAVGCEMVAMESTGSYWKPLINLFEEEGLPAMVVNAQHVKNVPGRKTDVTDAEWIAKLCQKGMLNASYIPDRDQREFREMIRYRKSLVGERTRETNRLIKILQGANIKLAETLSSVNGVTSQKLIRLLRTGEEITLEKIEAARNGNIKASSEQLLMAMEGKCSDLQKELIDMIIDSIESIDARIERVESLADRYLTTPFVECAKALEAIPGIGKESSRVLVTEAGIDMDKFKSMDAFCCWTGIAPGNKESGGKKHKTKTTKANSNIKSCLVQCAWAAVKNKDSYFYAQYQRMLRRGLGKGKAIVAVAHSIAKAVYHVLCGEEFKDLGVEYYNSYDRSKKIKSHIKQLQKLGVEHDEIAAMLMTLNHPVSEESVVTA